MKVVLHIGPHKTGTTTIQRFLFANARALRKRGIVYPKPWDGRYKHDAVAYGLRTPSLYDDTVRRVRGLLDEAARDRARLCILSTEMFVEEGVPIERLGEIFGGHDLHVVAYIRRPDHQWASAYAQLVREGPVRRRSAIDEDPIPYDCGYSSVFLKWMAHFPPGRMTIAPFDPPQWCGGSLEQDFLMTIGADDAALRACSYKSRPNNRSLPTGMLDLLRVANAAPMPAGMHVCLVAALEVLAGQFPGAFGPPARLTSPELVRRAFGMLEPHLPAYRPHFRDGFDESFLHADPSTMNDSSPVPRSPRLPQEPHATPQDQPTACAALVVIYNHRYEQNIELVERIYRDRFTRIIHLMPFYTGNRANVIPVYESSHHFQSFVAQAHRQLLQYGCTHYFFISDDLVLNPAVNERNFQEVMGLPRGHCYMPGFYRSEYGTKRFWGHAITALRWKVRKPGLEVAHQIPSPEEARMKLARHRIDLRPLPFERLWQTPDSARGWLKALARNPGLCARYAASKVRGKRYPLPYPLASGYSDIFIVTADVMREFARLCGIFASADLFVEHAIPTAMALSADWISEGPSLKLHGRALWSKEQMAELDVYGGSIRALLEGFPSGHLYLHPIKLSRWMVDLDEGSACAVTGAQLLEGAGMRQQVEQLRCDGSDLCLHATGGDPIIVTPRMRVNADAQSWAVVEVTVPQGTMVQLFYETAGTPHFVEAQSVRWRVGAGRHRLVGRMEGRLTGGFRLDPGTVPGEYRIHRLEVRQSVPEGSAH